MKYRKKPVVIDAVQWTGTNKREMYDFLTVDTFSEEDMQAYKNNFYIDHSKVEGGLIIKTLEGEHLATIGDYIIRGVKGEYYPCKEDIFHQTYEYAEAVEPTPYQPPVTFTQLHSDGTNLVPYSTICGCTTCGCTMGNRMVDPRFNSIMNGSSTFNTKEKWT
jgi:hypothetical protein